jgi:DNA-binding CsgD family transcriptional regulator
VRKWDLAVIEQAFAEAAVDPSRWNAAMEVVSEVTASVGAALFPFPKPVLPEAASLPFLPQSRSLAAAFEVYARDGWIEHDERYRCWPFALRRGVSTDFDFTTPEQMLRHPYYQKFLAPHGLKYFAGVAIIGGENRWALSIQRSIKQGPFLPGELKQLAKLSACLGSAATMARALGFSAANVVVDTFEMSRTAIVLLNRSGEPIKLNRQAERLLGSGIRVSKRRLVADTRDATDALDRAVHELIRGNYQSALMPPVRLPRPDRSPLLAYPLRLSSVTANVFSDCQALLILVDTEKRFRPPELAIRVAFKLSTAEARLAARLATGEALESASEVLGIAKETARNQLKSIFAKTGVHRQSELVALVASLLGPFIGAS